MLAMILLFRKKPGGNSEERVAWGLWQKVSCSIVLEGRRHGEEGALEESWGSSGESYKAQQSAYSGRVTSCSAHLWVTVVAICFLVFPRKLPAGKFVGTYGRPSV